MDGNYYEFFWWIGVLTCGLFALVYGALMGVGVAMLVQRVWRRWKEWREVRRLIKGLRNI